MEPPDRRDLHREPRLETTEPVQVTVYGESEAKFVARLINLSSHGIGLMMSSPLRLGATLKVEWSHTLLLGEVCHCSAIEEGFCVGLHLEQALYDVKSPSPSQRDEDQPTEGISKLR